MRIIANENIPSPVIASVRTLGHDVMAVKEVMRGATDSDVLARAQSDGRLIVTFDEDFGEIAFRTRLPAACGIVLFRLGGSSPELDNARAVSVLTTRDDWAGKFSVVTDDRIRMRPLPDL